MANKSYKGRKFEIWLAGRLSRWWTGDAERDDVFWHTHDSGGRATKRAAKNKSTKNLNGDICATDPIGQPLLDAFAIEAKDGYNDSDVHDILDKPTSYKLQQYEKWFMKAEQNKVNSGSFAWWLIHKRDRRDPLLFMDQDVLERFMGTGSLDCCWLCGIGGIKLETFLEENEPGDVLRFLSERSESA